MVFEKKFAGRGPAIMYRCDGCHRLSFDVDILGTSPDGIGLDGKQKRGECPFCGKRDFWEAPKLTGWEYFKASIRVIRGR